MATAQTPAPAGAPTNWLTEWQERTPVVSRAMVYITLPLTLLCILTGGSEYTALVPLLTGSGQVWRLFTAMLDQGGFFTVLFVALVLLFQAPAHEYRVGSTLFLLHTARNALLINVAYVVLSCLLSLIPDPFFKRFGFTSSQGLWGVIMTQMTVQALADPSGTTTFLCCPPIRNLYYPWFLVALFSLLAFFPQLDLVLGVILGHAVSAGALKRFDPSPRTLQEWEGGGGWVTRIRMAAAPGFVYAPTTVLPAGQRDVARERMADSWGAISDNMFGGAGARAARAGAQGGASGSAPAPAAGGAEGGGSSFMVRQGRGGGGGAGAAPSAFPTGEGRVLGGSGDAGTGAHGTGAAAAPSAGAAYSLSSLLGVGGGESAPAPAPSAGGDSAATAERRRVAAAAAEARLRAHDGRGVKGGSPRAGQTAGEVSVGAAGPAAPAAASPPPQSGYARALAARMAGNGLSDVNLEEGRGGGEDERVPLVAAAGLSTYPDEDDDIDIAGGLNKGGRGGRR